MAAVRGNVRLTGDFRSIGLVVLSRATVDSRLRCFGATLIWRDSPEPLDPPAEGNPDGFAFAAVAAQFRGGVALGWTVTGGVDLGDALTSTLADRPSLDWPADSQLGGFRYDRFASPQGGEQVTWDAGAWSH
jgi:hypothetical protein